MPFDGEKVKVSVGLCVKNCEKTVKNTLYSIIDQDFPRDEMEIIVVDGESRDETVSIITRILSEAGLKYKIYFDGGGGLGLARNMVIEKAAGEYILWVDGDVILTNDFIKKQVRFMNERPYLSISNGNRKYYGNSLATRIQRAYSEFYLVRHKNPVRFLKIGFVGATICKTESLKEVGGYDPNFKLACEDVDLVTRIMKKRSRVHEIISINHEAIFYHVKDSFRDVVIQQIGYGYGSYYYKQKYSLKRVAKAGARFSILPFIIDNLLSGLRAYKLSNEKISFFIPLFSLIKIMAQKIGEIKAHFT